MGFDRTYEVLFELQHQTRGNYKVVVSLNVIRLTERKVFLGEKF